MITTDDGRQAIKKLIATFRDNLYQYTQMNYKEAQARKEKIEKLMEIELNAYLEEEPGIKNGKYKRNLKTKYGEIKGLNVPRDRDSNFHTKVIEPYNRSIGMEDLIVSMYSNGISTRRIAGIMEDILGNKYSKSTISRITDLTIEQVYKFVNRPLDKRYIAIFLDGLFFYLRRGNVDKEPVIFALAIKNKKVICMILGKRIRQLSRNNYVNTAIQGIKEGR